MTKTALKLLVSFILLSNLSACSDSTNVEEYLAQAKSSLEQQDKSRAIIALKNAARLEPKNADVRFHLASAYIEQGDYFSAEKEMNKALKFGASNPFIYAKTIEIKVKLRKFDEAFDVVELANDRPDDEFLAVLTYAGIAALYTEDQEKAKDFIDRAVGISADSTYGSLGKVYLSYSDADFGAGIKVVNELLTNQPNFIEALLLKGYLLQNSKQFQKAGDTFLAYAKKRPKEIPVHYLIAQNYIHAYQYALAEPRVDFLLKLMKGEPVAQQFKAQILFQKKEYIEAKRYAELAVHTNEALKVSRVIAGFSAYKLNDFEQAYQHLTKVKDDVPADHVVNKLLIDLQLRLGYDNEALSSLRGITNVNEMDSSLLTNASYQLLQSGKVEEAKELLKTSISLNSQNPTELAKQGLIQFQLKQSEQGINLLEQALALDPELEFAENMLAATFLQADQLDDALKMAKEWQADDKKAARGYLLESSILLQNKQIEEAKTLLEKILTFESNNIPALYKLALYEHKKENAQQAFSYYTQVLNLRPNHVGAVKNLVILIRKYPELSERAITFYNGMLALTPNDEFALFGLSYIYKANKQYDKAIETFKLLIESSSTINGVELALGDIYKVMGEWDKAIDTYKSYLAQNPQNLAAAHKLFAAHEQLNQIDKSLEYVEKTRSYYPGNKGLLLIKVYYQSILKEAISTADLESLRKSPTIKAHWLFEKTLGNIAYINKDFKQSSLHYGNAYKKEKSVENVLNWVKSEGLNDNINQAIVILENFLKENQANETVQSFLASAYIKVNEFDKADVLFTKVLNDNAKNVVALNNLALIKLAKMDNKLALTYAEKAVTLVINNAVLLDTYGQTLTANQSYDHAIVIFDKALAYSDLDNKAEIMLHKAQALKLSGKTTALSHLLSELSNDPQIKLTDVERGQLEKLKN